jgi:hypothetical protein
VAQHEYMAERMDTASTVARTRQPISLLADLACTLPPVTWYDTGYDAVAPER